VERKFACNEQLDVIVLIVLYYVESILSEMQCFVVVWSAMMYALLFGGWSTECVPTLPLADAVNDVIQSTPSASNDTIFIPDEVSNAFVRCVCCKL